MKMSSQQWCRVPTTLNLTDLLLRGMRANDLAASKFWWEGPEFLKNDDFSVLQTAMKEHEKPLEVEHIWKRWMKEIVPQLNRRRKWKTEEKILKVGDVVVVITPETTRGLWPLGKVEEIFPGKDGKVRVIRIHLAGKTYIRPIHRLCKLLTCSDD